MSKSVVILGGAEVMRAIQQYRKNSAKQMADAINVTAQAIRTNAIKSIQRSPGTGVVYTKGSPSREHQASSPGNAPRTDTGRLAKSIRTEVAKADSLEARVGVESGVDYGFWLEFGTRYIAPRPFMAPAMESERANHERRMREGINKAAPK